MSRPQNPRIAILDAYDPAGRQALVAGGLAEAGELYRRRILDLDPEVRVDLVRFGEGGRDDFPLPAPLTTYDGICWTGSSLTIHRDTPTIRAQLALARAAFTAGIPSFGSCWAAQVAVTAAGGRCAANPRGREFGAARRITIAEGHRDHPLLAGRPPVFDAPTCHEDHIVELGDHAIRLARNNFSPVQAVIVRCGRGEFWAVQYHPEFGLDDLASLALLRGPSLLAEGFFADEAAQQEYVAGMRALAADPTEREHAARLGLGNDMLDFAQRTLEIRNWLAHLRRLPELGFSVGPA